MASATIAVLKGDGIGPEIVEQALQALRAVGLRFGHSFSFSHAPIGGAALDEAGQPLPEETLRVCLGSDGVLLGAVGGPKWDAQPPDLRPERGLLALRRGMELYANLRPVRLVPALAAACPLRADIAAAGVDLLVVRELISGIYFGEHHTEVIGGHKLASDVMSYAQHEIERILRSGFEAARGRRGKLTSVDKANVLATSRLWRAMAQAMAAEYPEVEFENMLVDNAAMQLVKAPAQFDVIVTENMFGDILSDEASMLAGSIGLVPSASLGAPGKPGLYEPVHGSAPDIAGKDKANPVGAILSAALLLRHGLGLPAEAAALEAAVDSVLGETGLRTADMAAPGERAAGCAEMGAAIAEAVQKA